MEYLFLLGGYDLEMIEIKRILDKNNLKYIDKNLPWGAKLSEYKEEVEIFKNEIIIVALELIIDLNFKHDNLIEIDHHNEKSDLPSAIEQVGDLLNIKLSRAQKLISENDKGYIPKMKEFGATDEEIEKIRFLDRRAQGVTKEDEKLAVEAVENKKIINGVIVVNSKTSKFSPIVDMLYPFEKLIIYRDTELTYYGKNAKLLSKEYLKILKGDGYFGGQGDGYFGIFNEKITENLLTEIINKVNEN